MNLKNIFTRLVKSLLKPPDFGETDEDAIRPLSPSLLSIEELDRELLARGGQATEKNPFRFNDAEGTLQRRQVMAEVKKMYRDISPPGAPLLPNHALEHISTCQLIEDLQVKIDLFNDARGVWGKDERMDLCNVTYPQVQHNASSVAAVCRKQDLIDSGEDFFTLKVKEYGPSFNLCPKEPFHNQPVASGFMFTGFLVEKNIIATAGHCAQEKNAADLRVLFGYQMGNETTPIIRIPRGNVYNVVNLVERAYCRLKGDDWALLQLDRAVAEHPVVTLSGRAPRVGQEVYAIGHPLGLPLKFAPGATIRQVQKNCFATNLDVYCGNSGSPVFDRNTHDVVGMVVRGDTRDFRWTGECWLSIIYPRPEIDSQGAQCTRVSEFLAPVKRAIQRIKN